MIFHGQLTILLACILSIGLTSAYFTRSPLLLRFRIYELNALKFVNYGREGGKRKLVDVEPPTGFLLEPNKVDMKQMAIVLSNITEFLDVEPEKALSVASQNIGWCFQRNIPKLTQMLLEKYPELRKDSGMMRAYIFLLDFLEAVSKETGTMLTNNQQALRILLEAAKVDDRTLINCIKENINSCCKEEFLVYLDSEIESQDTNSPLEALLITLRLQIIEEMGKTFGTDVTILPKLASLDDRDALHTKTKEHLATYESVGGMELFLQALRIMLKETTKRYKDVDITLVDNLREIERLTNKAISEANSAEE